MVNIVKRKPIRKTKVTQVRGVSTEDMQDKVQIHRTQRSLGGRVGESKAFKIRENWIYGILRPRWRTESSPWVIMRKRYGKGT